MRLLFVNKLYPPDIGGGAENVLAALVSGIQALGNDVLIATTTANAEPVDSCVDGIPVRRLPLRNVYWHHGQARRGAVQRIVWHARDAHNRAMGEALAQLMADFNPDVVTFHNLAGFSSAAWDAAFAQKRATIQVLHDYYHLCPRSHCFRNGRNCETPCFSCRIFRRERAARSDRLTAVAGVSSAVLDTHVRNGLFAQVEHRRVIYNARRFATAPARDYPPLAAKFGFMGTLAEWKGIRQLLQAFSDLARQADVPRLQLFIAGNGDAAYVDELRRAYCSHRIEFLGRVDPVSFLSKIDVCIVPSLWRDPLPSVVFESMLCGVPVIGARRGGIPEMISDHANGLVYEPEEPGALEHCIRMMAVTHGMLGRLGVQAQVDSSRFGDTQRVVEEHMSLIADVASKR